SGLIARSWVEAARDLTEICGLHRRTDPGRWNPDVGNRAQIYDRGGSGHVEEDVVERWIIGDAIATADYRLIVSEPPTIEPRSPGESDIGTKVVVVFRNFRQLSNSRRNA